MVMDAVEQVIDAMNIIQQATTTCPASFIQKAGVELSSVKRIIMTHTHLDHIGCLAEITEQIPWAELWVHHLEADLLERGDERGVYGMDMFRGLCQFFAWRQNPLCGIGTIWQVY
jgi:glyoxylase-like metal-dependent hydrolase (beta-lactamase superfamily II)